MATIVDALEWPDILNTERSLVWEPQFGNDYSPPTLDGTIQVRNGNGGGLWSATMNRVKIWERDETLAWQEMEALLAGGLEPVNVPWLMCHLRPLPASGLPEDISIRSVGTAAARATTMVVNLVESGELIAGMHFSRLSNTYGIRMYRITSVAAVSGFANQRSIGIWPPLRSAIGNDLNLNFNTVQCVMKLAKPDAMRLELDQRLRGAPSAAFVEAF